METEFTPFLSLAGGMLIGASAVLLMATDGRIAGISGLASKLIGRDTDRDARSVAGMFILGLLLSAPLWLLFSGEWPDQFVADNILLMATAGFLVGFGAVYGNGCTSGHGVCGIARGSARSIIATASFMGAAILTVFVTRHVFGGVG